MFTHWTALIAVCQLKVTIISVWTDCTGADLRGWNGCGGGLPWVFMNCLNTCSQGLSVITGLDCWTGPLDWTTGLTLDLKFSHKKAVLWRQFAKVCAGVAMRLGTENLQLEQEQSLVANRFFFFFFFFFFSSWLITIGGMKGLWYVL